MKGAYLTIIDTNIKNNFGVIKKINHQILAFQKLGCSMDFFHFHNQNAAINGVVKNLSKKRAFNKFQGDSYLYNLFLNNDSFEKYDFLYIRYPKASPFFISFLKKLKLQNYNIKVINEIPTYPYEHQWKTIRSKLIQYIDYLYRRNLYKYIDRIVTFYGQNLIFNIPTIKIGNGINTDNSKIITRNDSNEKIIRLVCIANLKFYHGYDRVIKMIANNKSEYKIIFNIVGGGPEECKLKELCKLLNIEDSVIFYGYKYDDELKEIISNSDIAIGTLGWHRANLTFDSALKTREYCAFGIPFVMSNIDLDFDRNFKYMLKVPASDDALDEFELILFFNRMKKDNNYQSNMHDYAINNLDWKNKINKVLNVIKNEL